MRSLSSTEEKNHGLFFFFGYGLEFRSYFNPLLFFIAGGMRVEVSGGGGYFSSGTHLIE